MIVGVLCGFVGGVIGAKVMLRVEQRRLSRAFARAVGSMGIDLESAEDICGIARSIDPRRGKQ